MIDFLNPVQMPNLNRARITKVKDSPDEDVPCAYVSVEVLGVGGQVYGPPDSANFGTGEWTIRVTDDSATCEGLDTKTNPVGFHDRIRRFAPKVTGAYTALTSAVAAETGNRAAKRAAAEVSLLATHVFGTGFTAAP